MSDPVARPWRMVMARVCRDPESVTVSEIRMPMAAPMGETPEKVAIKMMLGIFFTPEIVIPSSIDIFCKAGT